MAKKAKKTAKTVFPKPEAEEGAPDRFIPPDRQDQLENEPGDRAQVVQVKDLAADLEVITDDEDEDGEETNQRAAADDDEPEAFEGADDDGEEEDQPRSKRGRNHSDSRKVRAHQS